MMLSAHRSLAAVAVQLRNELTSSFGVELPPTVTFDYPTPAALAQFIAQQAAPGSAPAAAAQMDVELAGQDALPAAEERPDRSSRPAPAATAVVGGPSMQEVVAEVASIVGTVLGGDIGTDEPLMAAGLDSLGAWCGWAQGRRRRSRTMQRRLRRLMCGAA